jgi:hypothetical protein
MLFICDQDNICDGVADMIWYDMIWYDMIWYDMIWYDMIWYDQDNISHFSVTLDSHIIDMQIELLNDFSHQWTDIVFFETPSGI